MTLLDLPKDVDWRGSHETMEEFLDGVYGSCPVSNYLNCGKKPPGECMLCDMMHDQRVLDRLIYHRYVNNPEGAEELRHRVYHLGE